MVAHVQNGWKRGNSHRVTVTVSLGDRSPHAGRFSEDPASRRGSYRRAASWRRVPGVDGLWSVQLLADIWDIWTITLSSSVIGTLLCPAGRPEPWSRTAAPCPFLPAVCPHPSRRVCSLPWARRSERTADPPTPWYPLPRARLSSVDPWFVSATRVPTSLRSRWGLGCCAWSRPSPLHEAQTANTVRRSTAGPSTLPQDPSQKRRFSV